LPARHDRVVVCDRHFAETVVVHSILVVDDDEEILRTFARGLRHTGRTFTATSSAVARELVKREMPDAVVVDYLLGAENGIELVRELKAASPTRKVLLWSSYASVDIVVAAMKAGADDVKVKPIFPREVLHWLDTGSWIEGAAMPPSLERMQWEYVRRVVHDCDGNQSEAARRLRIQRATLRRHLQKRIPR